MTPLAQLIRAARESAIPTASEFAAREAHRAARKGGTLPKSGISLPELEARCNAGRSPGKPRITRGNLSRAERRGPRESTLAAICDALGLDVELVSKTLDPELLDGGTVDNCVRK